MSNQPQVKKLHIEVLRILAAFLVIVNHTNSGIFLNTEPSALWTVSITYFFICRIAVPVFLMIMGALLLDKCDDIRKYFSRIIRMTVVIAVASIAIHLYRGGSGRPIHLLAEILNSGHEPYWYLYLYLALLAMLPFLQKLAKAMSKTDIQLLLLLTLILAGMGPMFDFAGLQIHASFFDGLFTCYIGMMFAGYYVEKYLDITKKKAVAAAGCFVAILVFEVAVSLVAYYIKGGEDYIFLGDIKTATMAVSAVCVYIVIKYIFCNAKLNVKIEYALKYVGGLTFGIYLLADYFGALYETFYIQTTHTMHSMTAVIIYEILIFVSAAAATAILKCIPVIKKFI